MQGETSLDSPQTVLSETKGEFGVFETGGWVGGSSADMYRLGWTGDIMLFAPTANYLYDMSGFLANWLHDLSEEQLKDNHNVPPMVVPNCLIYHNVPKPFPQAAWVSGHQTTRTNTDVGGCMCVDS